jgi:hypothetical protein
MIFRYETEKGEEWLYIKGERDDRTYSGNKIINKKYLIKTLVNEACHSIIPEIKEKGSIHPIIANKFWVYQKLNDNSPIIKSIGIIKIKENDFILYKKSAKYI